MSIPIGIKCLFCLGCTHWAYKRCTHSATRDSSTWPTTTSPSSFSPIPRICRTILAVYEPDLSHPQWAPPPSGYQLDPTSLLTRNTNTSGRCPPYILYLDRRNNELILAVRGLDLTSNSDYKILFDNEVQEFDGGYVHPGLLKAAAWVLNREGGRIASVLKDCGKECKLVFAGHSLGAGVAAMMGVLAVNYLDRFGGIERGRVRCYAVAPPRCMSLSVAVRYADVINSVVLQDDFLPRTPTPLEHIFGSIFCLPCLLVLVCMRDTFISEEKKLKDPKRLYAPGRIYHIVERNPCCCCRRLPPVVRTAIPVEGRLEHIVLSCNAICDHRIVWIEREAQKALDIMKESNQVNAPPTLQMMDREVSLETEHKDAIERAMLLDASHVVPHKESSEENSYSPLNRASPSVDSKSSDNSNQSEWNELVEQLFNEEEPDDLNQAKSIYGDMI